MNNYLNDLSRLLVNQLSPEEYNNVMQYYTEYFADAGIEKQEEVIKELGTPEELASKIIEEYKGRQEEETPAQDNSAYYNDVVDESVVSQNYEQKATQEPVQTTVRPRRRLAKGWIALIVVASIIFSLPIIILCFRKIRIHTGLFNVNMVEQDYKVIDEFDSITIEADIADVEIVVGDEFAVEYVLGEDYEFNHNGDSLVIRDESFETVINSAVGTDGSYIKVYVPADKFVDIDMDIDIGDIKIKEVNFVSINVETDIGDVSIEGDSLGGNVFVAADTGDISVKGFLACDIEIEADLGKVNITSYYASSAYDCDISSDLGKETISDEGGEEIEEKYNIDVVADMGNVKIVFCDN